MSAENRALTTVVAKIIEAHRDEPRINPQTIATAALLEIDPKKVSLPAVLAGCHLALRQIARGLLRKRFMEPDEDEDSLEAEEPHNDTEAAEPEQPDLFPGLQRRYPASKQAGEYVLLEKMSDADIAFNVARLRKEGATKSKHADALEQFARDKKKASETVSPAAA
jgi:hypothetical protein